MNVIILKVRETDLVMVLNVMYQNGCEFAIVHRPRDARAIYEIEVHMGETE